MIDALACVIQYFKAAGLSTRQIAEKYRYGNGGWAAGTPSLLVRLDGGEANLDLPIQEVRLEVRCYAQSSELAMQMLGELITLSRATNREQVVTGDKNALLYWLLQDSGSSALTDEDLKMAYALMFFRARVAETEI